MNRLIALVVVLICTFAFSGVPGPKVDFHQAVEVWLLAAVRVTGPPDRPQFVNCYGHFEERVPREQQRLALALERVSGYLIGETFAEMHGDPATFKQRIAEKTDWSPAVVDMVRAALLEAGFVPGAGFPAAGLIVMTDPVPPKCDSGPCDCVPCDEDFVCDCKTPPVEAKDPCFGARKNCSTFEEKSWLKIPGQMAVELETR